jgi:hypothetical protein
LSLVGNNGVFKGDRIKERGKSARWVVEIQPMSQEWRHDGGKPGRSPSPAHLTAAVCIP